MTVTTFVRILWTVSEKIGEKMTSIKMLNYIKIVLTIFEKFEIFIERPGQRGYDCISSRKNFPTNKNSCEKSRAIA